MHVVFLLCSQKHSQVWSSHKLSHNDVWSWHIKANSFTEQTQSWIPNARHIFFSFQW